MATPGRLWDTGGQFTAPSWTEQADGTAHDEADHPDSLQGRGRATAGHACRPAALTRRLRLDRVAGDRRRVDRRDDRRRAGARRRAHRPPDQQQGARQRLPGRHGRRAEARRRRDRQHRRRQPVPRRRRREARRPDRRRNRRHGDRRPRRGLDRALLAAQEAPPATRLARRPRRLGNRCARHDVGLPRLQPRGRAADPDRLSLHLHARVDHPVRQAAGRARSRPGRHQPGDARTRACSPRRRPTCAATRSRSSASTPSTSRCACSSPPRRSCCSAPSASGFASSSPTPRATAPATSSR